MPTNTYFKLITWVKVILARRHQGNMTVYRECQIPQQLNLQLQMTDNPASSQNPKILSLTRLKADCKMTPVRVDFEPPNKPNSQPASIIPSFHHDRSYFTPCFVLPTDKKYYHQNSAFQKSQFEEKIRRSVQQTNSLLTISSDEQLYVAIPNSNFCQICQEKFDCYYQHISRKLHRTRTQISTTTLLFEQLCTEFRNRSKRDCASQKTKGIRKDSKRQEKSLVQKKTKHSIKSSAKDNQSLLKGQNFSTCIIQDSLLSFNM